MVFWPKSCLVGLSNTEFLKAQFPQYHSILGVLKTLLAGLVQADPQDRVARPWCTTQPTPIGSRTHTLTVWEMNTEGGSREENRGIGAASSLRAAAAHSFICNQPTPKAWRYSCYCYFTLQPYCNYYRYYCSYCCHAGNCYHYISRPNKKDRHGKKGS